VPFSSTFSSCFFFFQAEDGIRDRDVTGVQTCALPIWQAGLMLALLLRPKAALLGCECTAWRPVHLSSLCAVSVEGFGSTCLDPFSLQVGDVVSLKKKQLVEKLAALDVLICDEVTRGLLCRLFFQLGCTDLLQHRVGCSTRLSARPFQIQLQANQCTPFRAYDSAALAAQVSMLSAELFQYIVEQISRARGVHFRSEIDRLGIGSAGAVRGWLAWLVPWIVGWLALAMRYCKFGPPRKCRSPAHVRCGPVQERLRRLLSQPLCGLQLILVGDFLQVGGSGMAIGAFTSDRITCGVLF